MCFHSWVFAGVASDPTLQDCLRHYEILLAGCMPYFLDLAPCEESQGTVMVAYGRIWSLRWGIPSCQAGFSTGADAEEHCQTSLLVDVDWWLVVPSLSPVQPSLRTGAANSQAEC